PLTYHFETALKIHFLRHHHLHVKYARLFLNQQSSLQRHLSFDKQSILMSHEENSLLSILALNQTPHLLHRRPKTAFLILQKLERHILLLLKTLVLHILHYLSMKETFLIHHVTTG